MCLELNMLARRNLQNLFFRSLSSLQNLVSEYGDTSLLVKPSDPGLSKLGNGVNFSYSFIGCVNGIRCMSTTRGRSMRSKVEKRMQRETGKTLREVRRAKKLRKKLMTEEERLIYNLRRAKKKVALLLQKLKKYELPELPPPQHDPELLTPEQLQAYKKIGFRNRNYVPVGVRGVFGGVVQNMHLHWKFHETVQVCCDNFPKEKIREMASMLARLSGGIVVNIHNVKTIIMFRGRNYRQPKNLIPINTLTKRKALFKARFEQALESQKLNIKKIEQELRRKGVNPEDPVAMASIQRVASTFFRAIDEKQGSPYVFRENRQPVLEDDNMQEEPDVLPSEDSDQEELDRFIAEIEEAADKEWEAEEAAEKEEMSRIRYLGKDDNMRGRHPSWTGGGFDEEGHAHGRRPPHAQSNKQRTMDIRRWDSGDDDVPEATDHEEWDADIESVGCRGVVQDDFDSEDDSNEFIHKSRQKQHTFQRNARFTAKGGAITRRVGESELESEMEENFFSDQEDKFWESKEHDNLGSSALSGISNYHSDEDGGIGSEGKGMAKSKIKKADEGWDSD